MFSWFGHWISLKPSGSRWGVFALLLAISFFLVEGSGMIERWRKRHPKWDNTFLVVGSVFFAVALIFGLMWLAGGSQDTTASTSDTQHIEQTLNNINQELQMLNSKIDQQTSK